MKNEAETRQEIIDQRLAKAAWNVKDPAQVTNLYCTHGCIKHNCISYISISLSILLNLHCSYKKENQTDNHNATKCNDYFHDGNTEEINHNNHY